MGRRKQRVRWTSVEEGFFEGQGSEDVAMVVEEIQPRSEADLDLDNVSRCPLLYLHKSPSRPKSLIPDLRAKFYTTTSPNFIGK
jgi:hypothetical protein